MNVDFRIVNGYQSVVSDSRGHEVTLDLPQEAGGTNKGAKAFELLAMSLAGCIGTIFKMMANKMRLDVQELKIELSTTEDKTIEQVDYTFYIKSDSELAKIEKALALTEETCPVGILFHKAGVQFTHKIVMM